MQKKGAQNSKGKSGKFVLKTPKGTRDYNPAEMAVRRKVCLKELLVLSTNFLLNIVVLCIQISFVFIILKKYSGAENNLVNFSYKMIVVEIYFYESITIP